MFYTPNASESISHPHLELCAKERIWGVSCHPIRKCNKCGVLSANLKVPNLGKRGSCGGNDVTSTERWEKNKKKEMSPEIIFGGERINLFTFPCVRVDRIAWRGARWGSNISNIRSGCAVRHSAGRTAACLSWLCGSPMRKGALPQRLARLPPGSADRKAGCLSLYYKSKHPRRSSRFHIYVIHLTSKLNPSFETHNL